MNNDPYRICECGSNLKWKFCCKDKEATEFDLFAKEDLAKGQENLKIYTNELACRGVKLP